ncbi:ABC transporter permease [Streptomyces sp. NBC_00091]|uniref:ABC transporter permease n=1 Tax=Streptomyces sp. NBC_00091 TaxID=2975648 RepID=UPI00225ADF02|nr:FtsX-like permease family protein [Streptomyces sp. NBC_00091]MCX5380338.1 FtsX-like permease family protein [Streptomyces sp. NBC_00091]
MGSVTLAVGILGVLNIGLATVKERAEELALRRSLGATESDIAYLVLAESVLTGLAGALLSTALAVALFHPITALVSEDSGAVSFPVGAAATGIAAGTLAGLLGGITPAIRASRQPLAAVMRA